MSLRLKEIKLAGFKSFVDPTRINVASNLTAVVGPNGCGKSNIIDAIRWVMGESSAKTLRGGQIADVIFNGSSSRKPVGQASVELHLDNPDGALGGEYASYSQIVIRREVSRDGVSKYLLNGTVCRRKDITDIFLGTGLGPRSYSIIEQGMVTRIIEARPEDLRNFLEEAAQISRYRERRRETESRIEQTRDNMTRLLDLQDALDKQLKHLARQSESALRYQEYNTAIEIAKAQVLALEWQYLEQSVQSLHIAVQQNDTTLEGLLADFQHIGTGIENQRQELVDATDRREAAQKAYYNFGAELTRTEQSIERHQTRLEEIAQHRANIAEQLADLRQQQVSDNQRHQELGASIAVLTPELVEAEALAQVALEACQAQEQALQQCQTRWDAVQVQIQQPAKATEVQKTTIAHEESRVREGEKRIERLQHEFNQLNVDALTVEQAQYEVVFGERERQSELQAGVVAQCTDAIAQTRAQLETARQQHHALQSTIQSLRGRQSSLEALQQAALGQDNDAFMRHLRAHGLQDHTRLAQQVVVDPLWQTAVEAILGDTLQAVCLDDWTSLPATLWQRCGTGGSFVRATSVLGSNHGHEGVLLQSYIQQADCLGGVLAGIYVAADVTAAWALLQSLNDVTASVVTPEGIWMSQSWVRIPAQEPASGGVLAREAALKSLATELTNAEETLVKSQQKLAALQAALVTQEADKETAQQQRRQDDKALSEVRMQLATIKTRLDQQQRRRTQLQNEIEDTQNAMATAQKNTATARETLESLITVLATLEAERISLQTEREQRAVTVDATRQEMRITRDKAHAQRLRLETQRTEYAGVEKGSARITAQIEALEIQDADLHDQKEAQSAPLPDLELLLQTQLEAQLQSDHALQAERAAFMAVEETLRGAEQQRVILDKQIQSQRQVLEQLKMDWQGARVRQEGVLEQFQQGTFVLETVCQELPSDMTIDNVKRQVEVLDRKIKQLGPINLAAIEEYSTSAERKQYLDAQQADLTEALDTLESAIRKIDKETRQRFKETFDQVNTNFKALFPRLFGGGQAFLELMGDDLLDMGVTVMAQPPGKRNAVIQQLSGGEKALTAVALVFSIFQLNPAPFCLLDEVDAPLDEANVGRFSRLVREMSEKTQFIFITHNKVSMELADYLVGVTMREPGVSRMVSVNLEEAAAMAEAI